MCVDGDEHETYRANIIANYLYNKNLSNELSASLDDPDDFIYNQNDKYIKTYRYGFSTTGSMGCGWVATYNALKMLGDSMNPHDIIREFETNGVSIYGLWGTNAVAVARFFIKRGYNVEIAFNNFEEIADDENVANIMCYTHSTGGHFVAIKYDEKIFKGYNTFCNNTDVDNLGDSISVLFKNGDPNNKYTGRMLISINHKQLL